jgi:ABC-type bacteriocin/lantibiotic exporter with double-glycine peptidase domain
MPFFIPFHYPLALFLVSSRVVLGINVAHWLNQIYNLNLLIHCFCLPFLTFFTPLIFNVVQDLVVWRAKTNTLAILLQNLSYCSLYLSCFQQKLGRLIISWNSSKHYFYI